MCKYGYFSNRRWDRLLEDMGFNVITSKRFVRGCVYYQVIKNNRSDIVISKRKQNNGLETENYLSLLFGFEVFVSLVLYFLFFLSFAIKNL